MPEYKFEFNFCDISYYSQNCNNTVLYYEKHGTTGEFVQIDKDEYQKIRVEYEDDVGALGSMAFLFLLFIGIGYFLYQSLKATVN